MYTWMLAFAGWMLAPSAFAQGVLCPGGDGCEVDCDQAASPDDVDLTLISPNTNPMRNQWAVKTGHDLNATGDYCVDVVLMGWFDDRDPCGGVIPRTFGNETQPPPSFEDCGYDGLFVGFSASLVPGIDFQYHSDAPFNAYGYSSPAFDDLIAQWAASQDPDVRRDLAHDIQWLVHNDEPAAVLLYPRSVFFWSNPISGLDLVHLTTRADLLRVEADDAGASEVRYLMPFGFSSPMNPLLNGSYANFIGLSAMHSGIARPSTTEAGGLEPDLGTWSTADGLTYTVELDTCRTFHDGSPVEASDVAFTLEAARTLGQAVFASVAAVDDDTVEITLIDADGDGAADDFRHLHGVLRTPILSEGAMPANVSAWQNADGSSAHDPALGAGPYRFVSRDALVDGGSPLVPFFARNAPSILRFVNPGSDLYTRITTARYAGYDACAGGPVDAPGTLVIETEGTGRAVDRLLAGEQVILDGQYRLGLDRDAIIDDQTRAIATYGIAKDPAWQELAFNNTHPALDQACERVALSGAIDRPGILDEIVGDPELAQEGVTAWLPVQPDFDESISPHPDPAVDSCPP